VKFVLIGHYCADVFRAGGANAVSRPGGIVTPARVLAALAAPGDLVVPVCGVGAADHAALLEDLAAHPSLSTAGIFTLDGATPTVYHTAEGGAPGVTCARDIAPPIPFAKIRKHLAGADGVLVNMMSGRDIELETLDHLRMDIRPRGVPVLLDYHNLTTALNERFERVRRPLAEWRRWAFMNDLVQMNEEEMAGLGPVTEQEETVAGHFLTLSVRAVVVTRGPRGATVYTSEHKKVRRNDIAPPEVTPAADITGLGDVFGAAMLKRYAAGRDPADAAAYAAAVAAAQAPERAALTGAAALSVAQGRP
jgi:sugar/nucleoside kinase (ribokinase family)